MNAHPVNDLKRIVIGVSVQIQELEFAHYEVVELRDQEFLSLMKMQFEQKDKQQRRKFTPKKTLKVQTSSAHQVTVLKLSATHVGARLMANDQDIAQE